MSAGKDLPNCCAQVEHHRNTIIQRVALFDSAPCSRKGTVTVRLNDGTERHMCRQHATLAVQGFVNARGAVACKNTRSDYQRGLVAGVPPDFGLWSCEELKGVGEAFKEDLDRRHKQETAWRRRRSKR